MDSLAHSGQRSARDRHPAQSAVCRRTGLKPAAVHRGPGHGEPCRPDEPARAVGPASRSRVWDRRRGGLAGCPAAARSGPPVGRRGSAGRPGRPTPERLGARLRPRKAAWACATRWSALADAWAAPTVASTTPPPTTVPCCVTPHVRGARGGGAIADEHSSRRPPPGGSANSQGGLALTELVNPVAPEARPPSWAAAG